MVESLSSAGGVVKEGVPIDGTETVAGEALVTLDTGEEEVVTVSIDGTAAADYSVETSPDGETYFPNATTPDGSADTELQGITSRRDTFRTGSRYVRLVLESAAAAGGTATVAIEASG